ncbi:MAG: hypothetical protein KAX28_13260 [Candidatus Marinimicrobia bacterium]|nr:hypothetical protein [Candidatus Neomarinimicrobiota bacterium]
MDKCPICSSISEFDPTDHSNIAHITCKICGEYRITRTATVTETFKKCDQSLVSAALRYHNENGNIFEINSKNISTLFDSIKIPKTPIEKINRILMYINKKANSFDDIISIDISTQYPIAFAKNSSEFYYLLQNIENLDYITSPHEDTSYQLTLKGWDYLQKLNDVQIDSNQVFIAMWFNSQLNDIWSNGFKKAIEKLGLTPIRIDIIEHNQKVCDRIIAEIRKSGLVIADFTGNRENVYFEAWYAMGLGIPIIWTCRSDYIDKVKFDTRQYDHIVWESSQDLYMKLIARIEATFPSNV